MLRLRGPGVRVPVGPAAKATAARPPRPSLLKTAAAAARALYVLVCRYGSDAFLYSYLAVAWVAGFGGGVLGVLGRWVFGEGSAVEAAGYWLIGVPKYVMLPLTPVFFMLYTPRICQHVEFDVNKEKESREKLCGTDVINVASDNEQLPPRNSAEYLKQLTCVLMFTLYVFTLLGNLAHVASLMKLYNEKGSLMWTVGSVLPDITLLVLSILVGFVAVPIILVLVACPTAKYGDTLPY